MGHHSGKRGLTSNNAATRRVDIAERLDTLAETFAYATSPAGIATVDYWGTRIACALDRAYGYPVLDSFRNDLPGQAGEYAI